MQNTDNDFVGADKEPLDFIHQLIQTEFRPALTIVEHKVPTDTDGVVVLSFKEFVMQGNKIDYLHPDNLENIMRVETGIDIIKQVVADRANKSVDEIDLGDIILEAPPLIFSGSTAQLPIMEQVFKERAVQIFTFIKPASIDCVLGSRCNTQTQFETVNNHCLAMGYKHLIFVTSDYHVPRVIRTGFKNLSPDIKFSVIPVTLEKISYNVFQVVRGEVKRILAYAAKGDIVKYITPHSRYISLRIEPNNMSNFVYISKEGDNGIYSSQLVFKPETKPGALEVPVYEDVRGKIVRHDFQGSKFNVLETKQGFMRSGDLHKNTQFDAVLSGKIELWTLINGVTTKTIIGPNQHVVIKPHVPHLFNFLEDTVMIEWWDGPLDVWYYKPYRDIIDRRFKEKIKQLG